jgi:hypothetical protein
LPRDKPITVVSILGDSESTSFAIEIYEFLKSNGFKMHQSGITQAIFSGVPQGLARQDKPDGTVQFTVGVP